MPRFDPLVGKIPWRRKWQPTPVFLPGEPHGPRSLVGYSSRGHKESDTTERLHFHFLSGVGRAHTGHGLETFFFFTLLKYTCGITVSRKTKHLAQNWEKWKSVSFSLTPHDEPERWLHVSSVVAMTSFLISSVDVVAWHPGHGSISCFCCASNVCNIQLFMVLWLKWDYAHLSYTLLLG